MVNRCFPPAIFAFVVAVALAVPQEAAAQGRGRPKSPKSPTTTTPAPGTPAPVTAFRQFGSWLDDASAPTDGEGRTGFGIGYYRMSGATYMNLPTLDVGYGLTTRFQVSASVPFYRTTYEGTTSRGLDDLYLSGKYTLIDPAENDRQFGLAVSPVMEVLSAGAPDGRVHFAVPVSVEIRRQPFRVYGSAGYFTRGSVFSGAALEWAAESGLMITGALTQSYSVKEDPVLDALGVSRQRMDVNVGIGYPIGPAAAYVGIGRSLSSLDEGGASLAVSGGVSFRFNTPTAFP